MELWKFLGRFGSNLLMAIISASVIWMGSSFYQMTVLLAVQQSEFKTMNDNFQKMSSDFSSINAKLDQYALKADLKDYEVRLRILESALSKMQGKLEKQPIKLYKYEESTQFHQALAGGMGLAYSPISILDFPDNGKIHRPHKCGLRYRSIACSSVCNRLLTDFQRCGIPWHPPEFPRLVSVLHKI